MADEGAAALIVTVLIVGLIALVGMSVFGLFYDVNQNTNQETENIDTLAQTGDGGELVQVVEQGLFMPSELTSATVYDTNGVGLTLDGSGEVSAPAGIDTADDTWTACTFTTLDSDAVTADTDMTVLSVRGEAVIGYNGTADDWTLTYYDRGERVTYNVTADAAATQDNRTHLCARRTNTDLALFVNATDAANTTLDGSGTATLPATRGNLNGSLDETRTFSTNLTDSQIGTLHTSPVKPLVDNRGVRLMYDKDSGSSFPAFFAVGDAELSGGYAWGDGLDRTELTEGTDYELDSEDAQLELAGYNYEDHPQFYVIGVTEGNGLGVFIGDLAGALGLAGVVMVALMAGFVVMILRVRAM